MRQRGGFARNIGPNALNVNFDQGMFQAGVTGKLPEVITFEHFRDVVLEMVEELIEDARPHFDRVEQPQPPATGPLYRDHIGGGFVDMTWHPLR